MAQRDTGGQDYERVLEGIRALGGVADYRRLSLRLRQHHEETHRLCEQLAEQGLLARGPGRESYAFPSASSTTQRG